MQSSSEQNQECRNAIMDIQEYYDTIIPMFNMEEWIAKYGELHDQIQQAVNYIDPYGINYYPADLYPAFNQFNDLYQWIISIVRMQRSEQSVRQAMIELNILENNDKFKMMRWIDKWKELRYCQHEYAFVSYPFFDDATVKATHHNIEGIQLNVNSIAFNLLFNFWSAYDNAVAQFSNISIDA